MGKSLWSMAWILGVLAIVLMASSAAIAADTHEGKVVSASAGKLTMTDKDGKNQHSHDVATDAKITRDGKDAKLADLKAGDLIKVTTDKKGDKTWATVIVATSALKK